VIMMNLIILGPQGSGKGTQADLIAKKTGIAHISTGDMLRANVEEGTELGKIAEECMNKGQLVPNDITVDMLKERLNQEDAKKGFVLDGFPRNIEQANALDKITKIDKVVEVKVSNRESIRRIAGRRTCKCGAVYHTFYNPPNILDICDKCDSNLVQRDDDKEDVIRKRLDIYHSQTAPLIDHYKDKHIAINGEQTIEKVFEDICKELKLS